MKYTNQQIMMTLAAFASTAQKQWLLEPIDWQQQRMFKWINDSLKDTSIATAGAWKAIWVGLSKDGANMSYIAQNESANQFALCIRGTDFDIQVDKDEDDDVGQTASFAQQAGAPATISQGAMEAFTELTGPVYSNDKTTLAQKIEALANGNPGAQFFITGHSLGGCMATVLALYLQNLARGWQQKVSFQVYTFAAPTAGLEDFATLFARTFAQSSWRVFNVWDVVPHAWQSMANVETFYPGGPTPGLLLLGIIKQKAGSVGANRYAQPVTKDVPLNNQPRINELGAPDWLRDPAHVGLLNDNDFFAQVGFQHDSNTYLTLLGAPKVTINM
jgi:lipase (class 3)